MSSHPVSHRSHFAPVGPLRAGLAASALLALTPTLFGAPPETTAPKVTVAPVEQRVVTEYEEITGRVDATETVELRARVSGHLHEVHFRAGQLVRRGDVLFTIDPRWYQAQHDLAAARVSEARAHAEIAEQEARRARELKQASAISLEEAEARVSRASQARAAVASAEAAYSVAKLDLEHTAVRAPIDGRIGRALVTPGNLVSGSPGTATMLATIVSEGAAYVYADLDETTVLAFNRLAAANRLPSVDGRIPVELQLADENGFPRRGYIESTDNRLNPETGSLVLRMVFPNEDHALVPGLFARVRIPISAPQPALLVNGSAIGVDQGQRFVLALESGNKVAYRTVELGADIDGKRIVRSGLKPGDRIVVNGLQRVRPGMQVEPQLLTDAAPSGGQHVASR